MGNLEQVLQDMMRLQEMPDGSEHHALHSPTPCCQGATSVLVSGGIAFWFGLLATIEAGHHVKAEQTAFQCAVEERRFARFFQAQ